MKGDKKVIEYLNQGLKSELTAVSQYWLHYRLLEDWGLGKLASKWRAESIEEMNHADRFIERILFLEGRPNLQELNPLNIGETLKDILEADLAGEHDARALYLEARNYCNEVGDHVSKDIFEQILTDEEGHIGYLETQIGLLSRLGEANYSMLYAVDAGGAEPA